MQRAEYTIGQGRGIPQSKGQLWPTRPSHLLPGPWPHTLHLMSDIGVEQEVAESGFADTADWQCLQSPMHSVPQASNNQLIDRHLGNVLKNALL